MSETFFYVSCPCCNNKRLFDVQKGSQGIVAIKCPRCRSTVAVSLHNGQAAKQKT